MRNKIVGVTLGWSCDPVLEFEGGKVLPGKLDRILYKEYYAQGDDWPRDPITGIKLEITERDRPGYKKKSVFRKKLHDFYYITIDKILNRKDK
jgi:hypothetical protein